MEEAAGVSYKNVHIKTSSLSWAIKIPCKNAIRKLHTNNQKRDNEVSESRKVRSARNYSHSASCHWSSTGFVCAAEAA